MAMERSDEATPVTEDDVRMLAQVAGLPLQPGRAATLARALEADLRAIRRVRAVDAGDAYPAGVAPLAEVQRDG
ncbi:MAG TPA: hypothetical protein VKF37_08340 [Chloroflexota bacterium]|jgi:hypothetical protein|nr:hypothetical protein [Chloroflexota bacterium]